MTFCLHANQKTASCGTWENSSSWRPCIPQRFPKICCTHGPHIGSKSFLPKLSGLLGFCRVPQLASLLIKYVHVQRRKHIISYHIISYHIISYIYIYIYAYTLTRDIEKTHHATDTNHINALHMARPAWHSNLHRNSWLLPEGGVLCQNSQEMKKRIDKECK